MLTGRVSAATIVESSTDPPVATSRTAGELISFGHPILEEIGVAGGLFLEQGDRILGIAVLGQDHDAGAGMALRHPMGGLDASLQIGVDGSTMSELVGASPFPRHWTYDAEGSLTAKSGGIDFTQWTKEHDFTRSPWHDVEAEPLVAEVESVVERSLSRDVMAGDRSIRKLEPGVELTTQGEPGDELYLVLDGLLQVEVVGAVIAELGPGAIVGERAILEGGLRTSTVRTVTKAKGGGGPARPHRPRCARRGSPAAAARDEDPSGGRYRTPVPYRPHERSG